MKIGAHVSSAGGLFRAPENASALGLECFQFFDRPPQGGRPTPISDEDAKLFLETCSLHGFDKYYIHAPYVINLASLEKRIRENTVEILRQELDRGSILGATGMMFHPGSAKGADSDAAIKLVIDGMRRVLDGYSGKTRFLIEISAGAGEVIADTFEEVRALLDGVQDDRVGVCFDTAHAFASGYDLRTAAQVETTMRSFDDIIGLERLAVSHCNDSQVGLGEKKDRHAHLGEGKIGLDGFRAIVASPFFSKVNLILETPPEGVARDIKLLKELRNA